MQILIFGHSPNKFFCKHLFMITSVDFFDINTFQIFCLVSIGVVKCVMRGYSTTLVILWLLPHD